MTWQGDVTTQDDISFDDMAMDKYHLKDQELSLEELYLTMEISFGEQANSDLVEAKLNEETYNFSKRINLQDKVLGCQVDIEA